MEAGASDSRTASICAIAALAFLSSPGSVLGQDMNLTGTLNVNDTQVTSTSNLLLSMLVSLAESIIPIVVGAAVGHKSIAYWHEKKAKMATRSSIRANYALSFKMHSTLMDNFAHRVFKSYVTFTQSGDSKPAPREYSSSEDKAEGFLKFPSDPSEFPSKRFYEEYAELDDKINGVSQARESLYMDLKYLRADGTAMIERLQNIREMLAWSEALLDKFVKSVDADSFASCYNLYSSLSGRIKNEAEKVETELVKLVSGRRPGMA